MLWEKCLNSDLSDLCVAWIQKKKNKNMTIDTLRMNDKKNNQLMYKYWGKARKKEDGKYDYHLLVYHCLDVAAVGKDKMS